MNITPVNSNVGPRIVCPDCHGKGVVDVDDECHPGEVLGWRYCKACYGAGVIPDIHGLRAT